MGKHFQNIRDTELLGLNMSLGLELSWELHKGNCKNSKVKSSQHMVKSHFPKSPANDKSLSRKPPKGLNFQTQMCLGGYLFSPNDHSLTPTARSESLMPVLLLPYPTSASDMLAVENFIFSLGEVVNNGRGT